MEDTSDAVLLRDCETIRRISLGTSEAEVTEILTALPQRVTVAKNYTLQLLRRPWKNYDPKRFFVFKPLEHNQQDGQIHCLLGKLLHRGADTEFMVTKRPQDEDIVKKSSGAEDAHSSEYCVMLDCLSLPGAWRWRPPEQRRLGRDTLLERSLSFATLRPGRPTDELDLSGMSNRGFHIGWANPPNVWTAGDSEAGILEADYEKALTGIELAPLYGRPSTTMTKLKHLMDAAGIQQKVALQVLSRFEREPDGARLWAKLRSITATSKYADFQALNRLLSRQRGPSVPLTIRTPEQQQQQQQQTSTASFELHPYAGSRSSIASDSCRIDTVPDHTHTLIGEGKSR